MWQIGGEDTAHEHRLSGRRQPVVTSKASDGDTGFGVRDGSVEGWGAGRLGLRERWLWWRR